MQSLQNSLLAVLDGSHADAEQTVAEDSDRQHGGQHVLGGAGSLPRIHQFAEHEKENQRKDVVEEDDDALTKSQLHLCFQESEIDADHDGSSVCSPVSLRKRSSRVGLE